MSDTPATAPGDSLPRLVRRYLVRAARSLRISLGNAACFPGWLYSYTHGKWSEDRLYLPPTEPRALVGAKVAFSALRWQVPQLRCAVCDGHGEHYGYPRHYLYIIIWWKRVGYAWGVEFSTPNA